MSNMEYTISSVQCAAVGWGYVLLCWLGIFLKICLPVHTEYFHIDVILYIYVSFRPVFQDCWDILCGVEDNPLVEATAKSFQAFKEVLRALKVIGGTKNCAHPFLSAPRTAKWKYFVQTLPSSRYSLNFVQQITAQLEKHHRRACPSVVSGLHE